MICLGGTIGVKYACLGGCNMKSENKCPECGTKGIEVEKETIGKILKKRNRKYLEKKKDYFACTKKGCKVVYFCEGDHFDTEEVKGFIWFKDDAGHVPICYCYGISRQEIQRAVENGCKTINEVRKFTKKKKTGKCKKKNPLGKSCSKAFEEMIELYRKKK